MRKRSILIILVIGLLVIGYALRTAKTLPGPEVKCPVTLNWQGLVPGQSTIVDVTKRLGTPSQTGIRLAGDRLFPSYEYAVKGGQAMSQVQDRIYFRLDGVVEWIEAVVADRDGKFHPASETINQLGNTLDTAYVNNNWNPSDSAQHDILAGPDQLYVWSECGLALDVDGICSPAASAGLRCLSAQDLAPPRQVRPSAVVLRHPNPYPSIEPELLGADNAVLFQFLFPPTSYEGFVKFYMHKIPYGLWDQYLRAVPTQ